MTASTRCHRTFLEQLGGNATPLADAIWDRIVHDDYVINIETIGPSKEISMKEIYGLNKAEMS